MLEMGALTYKLLLFIVLWNLGKGDCPSQKSCGDCLATSGCGYCAGSGCFPSTSSCGSIWLKTPYNCPKNSTVSYDEAYVRNSVFPLIGATHATSENEILACASKMALDAQHVQRINVTCGLTISDPCVADLYVFPSKRLIAVVFHGSRTEEQFVHQAQQFLGKIQMKDLPMGGKVIEYYATGFDSLYNGGGLKATLQQLLNKNPGSKVLITGHSLGGALATIVATTIAAEGLVPSNSIQLISSGSPRVGDSSFGTMVERLLPYRFRVVNQNDLVPELPPLNRNDPTAPQHITFEVFYKSGMTSGSSFTLCQMNEDPTCRNSIPSSNLTVHPLYFAVPIDTWFKKGCTY